MLRELAAAAAITLISVSDEIKLGREAQKQVRASTPQVGGATAAYVASVGKQLAAKAGGPKYPYRFSVANYRDLNAFALPGGPVWVNRGVLQAARTEAQVAGVLAHEIAHIARASRGAADLEGSHRERPARPPRRRARERRRRPDRADGSAGPRGRLHDEIQPR